VVYRCKGGGIKALCVAVEVHSMSPMRGTAGGPAGVLAGVGACGSASPGGSRRGQPNDGTGLGREAVRRVGAGEGTPMRRVVVRHVVSARGSAPWHHARFQFQSAHVWVLRSINF
jgi:hypothetical protein